MLPEGQSEQIKKQLIEQISSTFPEDKKESAISQIEVMDDSQLEEFLKQNNLIKDGKVEETGAGGEQKCIFCSIVSGEISTYKIEENSKAIAVLDINPISKGHCLIIPKEHITSRDAVPKEVAELAEKVIKKIKSKLKPKDVQIHPANVFGHEVLNVLPIYGDENLNSPRNQAKPEELLELQGILTKIEEKPIEKAKPEKLNPKKLWLPKRLP